MSPDNNPGAALEPVESPTIEELTDLAYWRFSGREFVEMRGRQFPYELIDATQDIVEESNIDPQTLYLSLRSGTTVDPSTLLLYHITGESKTFEQLDSALSALILDHEIRQRFPFALQEEERRRAMFDEAVETREYPFDAVYVTVYGVALDETGHARPNDLGRLQIQAAYELIQRDMVRNVAIGGTLLDTPDGSISHVYAEALREKMAGSDITDVKVFAEAEMQADHSWARGAKETGGEVDFLHELVWHEGFWRIGYLFYPQHGPRIQRLLRRRNTNFHVVGKSLVENPDKINVFPQDTLKVLDRTNPRPLRAHIARPGTAGNDASFRRSEAVKNTYMDYVNPSGSHLTWMAEHVSDHVKKVIQQILYVGQG